MSLATLKKKTQAQYHNMSVGSKTGFSLVGTHRSQGFVGQTMLSRSLPRTLMKGITPKGHGGCCGKYVLKPIVQSGVTSTENPKVLKSSVLGTDGMLATKYRWIRRPQPFSTFKLRLDNVNSQQSFIERLKKKTIACVDASYKVSQPNCCKNIMIKKTNFNQYYKAIYFNKTTKPKNMHTAISSGERTQSVLSKCRINDLVIPPTKLFKTPIVSSR